MKICDTKDHGEIVFEGRDCEACEAIRDLKEQIKDLVVELRDSRRRERE